MISDAHLHPFGNPKGKYCSVGSNPGAITPRAKYQPSYPKKCKILRSRYQSPSWLASHNQLAQFGSFRNVFFACTILLRMLVNASGASRHRGFPGVLQARWRLPYPNGIPKSVLDASINSRILSAAGKLAKVEGSRIFRRSIKSAQASSSKDAWVMIIASFSCPGGHEFAVTYKSMAVFSVSWLSGSCQRSANWENIFSRLSIHFVP